MAWKFQTKPWACLFCGEFGQQVVSDPHAPKPEYAEKWVQCMECGARGPVAETDLDAIKSWNAIWKRVFGRQKGKAISAEVRSHLASGLTPTNLLTHYG